MKKIFLLCLLSIVHGQWSFAAVVSEPVEYKENGETLQGFVYFDDAVTEKPIGSAQGKRPGVIVVHEWKGLGDYAKKRAEMLAGLGYVAFAADMYGKGVFAKDHEEAGKLSGVYFKDRNRMRARAAAAYNALIQTKKVDQTKVAAVGYCFGGATVLEMARASFPLKGVASFHGILSTPAPSEPGRIQARVLVLTGADDKMVPLEQVRAFEDEMRVAVAQFEVVSYEGAAHSFTVWDANMPEKGIMYNEKADKESWEKLKNFLAEIFKVKS